MHLIDHMPPNEFDIRVAMGISDDRSGEIELGVKEIFERVSRDKQMYEMSTIIEECLNRIPQYTAEAIWTIVLIMKYEDMAKYKPVGPIN